MPDRWNSARWTQNEDGTYSKRYVQLDSNGAEVAATSEEVKITKAAAELAEELGVDPASIEGSGADGRITKDDVEEAAASQ